MFLQCPIGVVVYLFLKTVVAIGAFSEFAALVSLIEEIIDVLILLDESLEFFWNGDSGQKFAKYLFTFMSQVCIRFFFFLFVFFSVLACSRIQNAKLLSIS